jgi:hypothetical protein
MFNKKPTLIFVAAFIMAIVSGILFDFKLPGTGSAIGFFSFITLFIWAHAIDKKSEDNTCG